MNRLIEKLDGGLLLKFEAVAYGIAGIDQQADLQRKVRLCVKAANFLGWFAVVEHLEVALLQIGNTSPVLVGHREDYVHFVGGRADPGEGVIACGSIGIGRLLLRRGPRCLSRRSLGGRCRSVRTWRRRL